MEDRCTGNKFGMSAIIGLTMAEITAIIREGMAVVNVNSDTCVICAGLRSALDACNEEAKERGAITAELLAVGIPYHHPVLLAGAADKMRASLGAFKWRQPMVPIVSSIDGTLLDTAEAIADYTARHLCTPINWLGTVQALFSSGVTRIVECGPGVSLSRHGLFMPFPIAYVNVKNMRRLLHL